jgi:hypothetical protein
MPAFAQIGSTGSSSPWRIIGDHPFVHRDEVGRVARRDLRGQLRIAGPGDDVDVDWMSGFSALKRLIIVVMIPHSPSALAMSVLPPYSAPHSPKKRCR